MEGFAITLIGGSIFMHSWHLLRISSDGRTSGVLMMAMAAGLLFALTFEPQLLGTQGDRPVLQLAEVTVMKTLIVMWAIYSAVVGAQAIWDLEERAIGLYSVGLAVVSGVALFYFFTVMLVSYTSVMLEFSIVAAALVVVSALLIAMLAVPVGGMRSATAWVMLSLSIVVVAIGLAMYTTFIAYG